MMAELVVSRRVPLEFHDLLRLQTLGAFRNNEFDLVAFAEGFESGGLDCRVMDEDVIAGCSFDETVALFVVEPLDSALFFHFSSV